MKTGQGFLLYIKVIRSKVRQRRHRNPLFRHIRDEISKKWGKKVHWASTGHQTQFSSKFGAKLGYVLSFPERFQPITATAMCTVARLEWPSTHQCTIQTFPFCDFMDGMKLSHRGQFTWSEFLFFFCSFFSLAQFGGMKHQIRDATQAQQGMTFMDNSICYWPMTANRDDLAVRENTHQYACVWILQT
jgi:hypothetical protein